MALTELGGIINLLLILGLGDGLDLHAVGKGGDSLGHITVARLQSVGHDICDTVILWIDLYLAVLHLVVLAHEIYQLLVLNLGCGCLWNDDGAARHIGYDNLTGSS